MAVCGASEETAPPFILTMSLCVHEACVSMTRASPHLHADYDLPSPQIEMQDGVPHATLFGDSYYNADDGLAETRHVFLDGNDLPERMAAASHLTIAETGFGTGLNLLAVMAEMKRHAHLQLDYISFEAQPMDAAMMAATHAAFPEIAVEAEALRAALPPRWPGYHLVVLCAGRLTLHLHYGEVGTMLPMLDMAVDSWFLDGFAPARNPSIWTADILMEIGRLTVPNGSFASFTVAGSVRRGLEVAGFAVEKAPGYGRKRNMIRGRKAGHAPEGSASEKSGLGKSGLGKSAPERAAPARIAIIGAGIAGAALAAGLLRRGATPLLVDSADVPARAASGNRAALQSPRLTVDHNPMSRLSAACLSWAARASDAADAVLASGVLAMDAPERMAARHAVFRQQNWPDSLLRAADPAMLAKAGGNMKATGIFYTYGRAIRPAVLVNALADGAEFTGGFDLANIDTSGNAVRLLSSDGRELQADAVVLAGGARLASLLRLAGGDMPVEVTRGQVSHVPATRSSAQLDCGVSYGGYMTPAYDGLHEMGATFSRDPDAPEDDAPEDEAAAHAHNFALLPDGLKQIFNGVMPADPGLRTSYRASLADRRPVMGRVGDNVWMLGGLGARGFTLAPLLGEMLAAEILQRPVPLARDQRAGIAASRYVQAAAG